MVYKRVFYFPGILGMTKDYWADDALEPQWEKQEVKMLCLDKKAGHCEAWDYLTNYICN